jgi:hypothetical protein
MLRGGLAAAPVAGAAALAHAAVTVQIDKNTTM